MLRNLTKFAGILQFFSYFEGFMMKFGGLVAVTGLQGSGDEVAR